MKALLPWMGENNKVGNNPWDEEVDKAETPKSEL